MSRRRRFRVSTIEEVWDFLHPFVVHAAQRNINLEGRNPVEVDGGIPRLHLLLLAMAEEPDDVVQQWLRQWAPHLRKPRRVQRLLGLLDTAVLNWLTRGWDGERSKRQWAKLGRRLHAAYVEARTFPDKPFQPTQWATPSPRDPHNGWVYDDRSDMYCLKLPDSTGSKLYVTHSGIKGTLYRWVNGISNNGGEAPTVHAAKVAVEQDLTEHLRKMLAFMGAS